MGKISPELLKDLRCPRTRAPLVQCGDWLYVCGSEHRLKYPIRKGIPVLLADEAVDVDEAEYDRVVGKASSEG